MIDDDFVLSFSGRLPCELIANDLVFGGGDCDAHWSKAAHPCDAQLDLIVSMCFEPSHTASVGFSIHRPEGEGRWT